MAAVATMQKEVTADPRAQAGLLNIAWAISLAAAYTLGVRAGITTP